MAKPVYIIAEMANSHEGSFADALALLKAAGTTGADAVKSQVIFADELTTPEHQDYGLFKDVELPPEKWIELRDAAHDLGMDYLVDVFGLTAAQVCSEYSIGDAYKIHASDLLNPPLMDILARLGKRLYLSAGGIDEWELKRAIEVIRAAGNDDICIMHGFAAEPTPIEESPLRRMATWTLAPNVAISLNTSRRTSGKSSLA